MSGVQLMGKRQRSPRAEIFDFSMMAGHHLIMNAARPGPNIFPKPDGGKNEMRPLSVYATKSGQFCKMFQSPETIMLPSSAANFVSHNGSLTPLATFELCETSNPTLSATIALMALATLKDRFSSSLIFNVTIYGSIPFQIRLPPLSLAV